MPKIIQLSPHVANLIAAGEVVERPASVAKELLENAVDAGASAVTLEIRDGGMTFLRVTDNGCGMTREDARIAFLRHATSKLRTADELASIATMGFRGEALAAIASVSRVDLLTRTAGMLAGTSLHLEAGNVTEESEAGCPEGTTILVRDLFFNTPARMKFMKSDTVEGARVAAAVQLQALAHPSVAFRFLRDGKQVLSTPGTGKLQDALYCVYGRECAGMVQLESKWDGYTLTGFVSKPTDARPSRSLQTFFVNGRPVRSRLLSSALEEAYRNQIMIGKFPACVLHLTLPANAVDVNVHPAKTEVKFLNEKAVFDCIHYGVLGALNRTPDRPAVQFPRAAAQPAQPQAKQPLRQENFFRTMTPEEYKRFSAAMQTAPQPSAAAARAALEKLPPQAPANKPAAAPGKSAADTPAPIPAKKPASKSTPVPESTPATAPVSAPAPAPAPAPVQASEEAQIAMPLPAAAPWRLVGELYRTYVIVEQGDDTFLIDKHAAHERILFDKLKGNPEGISAQSLLSPIPCRLSPEGAAELLTNKQLLGELGFEIEEFGDNTVLLRQIPMDLSPSEAADAVETLSADLLAGKQADPAAVRDTVLHTVACKAAIKAGWHTDEKELLALVREVMAREDLKYCPHGRPICTTLSKKQLEKQFKRV